MNDAATRDDFDSLARSVESLATSLVTNIEAQTHAMQDLAKAMTDQRHVEPARASGGKAEVHFNAGGAALWLSVTMCSIMLVVSLFLGAAVYWSSSRTNDQGHQMNSLYQSVPGLRELVDRQMKLIDRTNSPPKQEPKK